MGKRVPVPTLPSLKRPSAIRQPKVEFVIACEGRATEPEYLRSCIEYYGAGSVRLRILRQTGVPLTLVEMAIAEREKLLRQYRSAPERYSYGFVVWVVFDRDVHPNYDKAIELAQQNKILLAVSNPCFEIWPQLHLSECHDHLHRHDMQASLSILMPSYHHDKNPIVDFDVLAKNVDAAEKRALILEQAALTQAGPFTNPTTTMYQLVRAIINNGKSQPKN